MWFRCFNMAQFQIKFTDHKGFYYPGESITGSAIVNLGDEIRLHNLILKFKGKSYCLWTEGTRDGMKFCSNREEYCKQKVILLTSTSSTVEIFLGPGEFNYPFSF